MAEQTVLSATDLDDEAVQTFESGLRGQLVRPGDATYDVVRSIFNGMIDRRPALIVRCAGVADVVSAVNFARDHRLLVAVRGGGHNVAGNSMCDGGMVIDLSLMKGIRVDPSHRTARAEGGVTWGELDHETQAFGLATTGGLVSTTGIAGFTLGGGLGWLMRKYGVACDNLLSADVVTADGQLVTASATQNEDLFWGIRGGGGNFGVVTSFEFPLYPVGPIVLGGLVLHPFEKAKEVLDFYRRFVPDKPEELNTLFAFITAPPAPFVPEHLQGTKVVAVIVAYSGELEEGERIVQPLKEYGPPLVDVISPMPYTVLQSLFDEGTPPGLQNYWKSAYLTELSEPAIDTLVSHVAEMTPPLNQVHIHQMGGAVTRNGGTAFTHRDALYALNIIGFWPDPGETERNIAWVRSFWDAMQPYASGVYVNFLGDEGQDLVRAAYDPETYRRLVELKNRYDPTNLFHLNQNIKPTA